ncbi:hypothetical protein TNCV_487961 [Trichonephila clavipes]|nr:hypothetical protein TNCV_487961 [Trichonephila clavipes]
MMPQIMMTHCCAVRYSTCGRIEPVDATLVYVDYHWTNKNVTPLMTRRLCHGVNGNYFLSRPHKCWPYSNESTSNDSSPYGNILHILQNVGICHMTPYGIVTDCQ